MGNRTFDDFVQFINGDIRLSMVFIIPSIVSVRLWGGMLVAIPTGIPDEPLTNRFGTVKEEPPARFMLVKFGLKSTVSLLISASFPLQFGKACSVYLMAAGASPSTDPSFVAVHEGIS